MKDAVALRADIQHLLKLASMISDRQTLAAIDQLIRELERQLREVESAGGR